MFAITHTDKQSRARTGVIQTAHGDIETPAFMPVGTQATVKSLDVNDLNTIGVQIILSNTYHLHLRPRENLIASMGGLHAFTGWNKPILTDSGGFQVFSLQPTIRLSRLKDKSQNAKLVKIDEDGVTFRSYIDGSTHRFTPEIAMDIQHKLGADIIMAFDECTPDEISETYAREAMERTHRWAERCIQQNRKNKLNQSSTYSADKPSLFGIIQGGKYKNLRQESARVISSMNFDGIAIGGESIGYNMQATKKILEWVMPLISDTKPHYTMGVGYSPLDIFEVVERGIDMFDCVAPTRIARNGTMYISPATKERSKPSFTLNINNARFRADQSPLDPTCACFVCTHHSRAYLHHLFRVKELLAYRLASIHNLHFFLQLMKDIRKAIQKNSFLDLKNYWKQ